MIAPIETSTHPRDTIRPPDTRGTMIDQAAGRFWMATRIGDLAAETADWRLTTDDSRS
jgi:hypothetical protein